MTYDGLGRRTSIETVQTGKSTLFRYFLWCGATICQMRDGGNSVLRGFYPEGEYLTAKAQGLYYGPDQLGSTRIVDDPAASAIYAYDYDPLGNPTSGPGNTAPCIKFRYAGMYYDDYAGLNLTQYRAYNPAVGRWTSRDPLGEASDPAGNLYRYVDGDPIGLRDPMGLWTYTVTAALGYGSSINLRYNGGQWSVGAYAGAGEGLSGVYSGRDTGCKPSGFEGAAVASGALYGAGGTGANYELEATSSGEYSASANVASSGVGATITAAAGEQGLSVSYSPTVGVGESYFVGIGGALSF